jgi:isoamylase
MMLQDMIIAALRYWVQEMHVDGFRFDLGSIMTRAHSVWHPQSSPNTYSATQYSTASSSNGASANGTTPAAVAENDQGGWQNPPSL